MSKLSHPSALDVGTTASRSPPLEPKLGVLADRGVSSSLEYSHPPNGHHGSTTLFPNYQFSNSSAEKGCRRVGARPGRFNIGNTRIELGYFAF